MNDPINPIIKHLANLKFYADFKRSPARTFDQYVEFIDSGAPQDFNWFMSQGKPVIEKFAYRDPLEDIEFEDKIEDFLAKKEMEENVPKKDLEVWLQNVTTIIEEIIDKEFGYILLEINHLDDLNRLIKKHDRLRNLINIGDDDFYKYASWMQQRSPKDFFLIFSEKNDKVANYPLINCFPRIFIDCKAYAFFLQLLKQKKRLNNADFSVIFHEMSIQELILCPQAEFKRFLNDKFSLDVEIYPKEGKKLSNPEFLSTYNSVFNEMF